MFLTTGKPNGPSSPSSSLPAASTATHTATATVQTVMTLCNCPYLPQSTFPEGTAPVSATQEVTMTSSMATSTTTSMPQQVATATKSIQTSLENLPSEVDKVSVQTTTTPTAAPGVKVKKELFPEAVSKERQLSLPADSIPRDQIDRLIQQYRKEDPSIRPDGRYLDVTPEKSPLMQRRPKSGSLYSEWLKREYKQPKLEYRKAVAAEKDSDSVFDSPVSASPKASSTPMGGSAADVSRETMEGQEEGGDTIKLGTGEEVETDAKPPQMPRSPVIRSKYPRKMRTNEARMQNLYAAESQAAWKATPLRRALRHRKTSNDKSPDGSAEAVCLSDESSVIRERTKSDSSILHPPTTMAIPCLTKQYLSVDHQDDQTKGVMGMISKYEQFQQQATPTRQALSVQNSPLQSRAFRKSPSPLAVSPVRRLKTAKELLQDCKSPQEPATSKKIVIPPREQIPSCSSDKENDKGISASKVLQMIQRFSAEGSEGEQDKTPERSRSGSVERPARASHKLSTSSTGSPCLSGKPPLKDLTNEGQGYPSGRGGIRGDTNGRDGGTEKGRSILPGAKIETLDTPIAESMRTRSSTHPGTDKPDLSGTAASETTATQASPLNMRSGKGLSLHNRQAHRQGNGSDDAATSPWQLQEKKSPKNSRQRKVTAPSKPGSPSKSSSLSKSNKGAISALCMQAMNISVETSVAGMQEVPPSSPGGKDKKEKSKNKFLDSYRKLFKVSK